tara:strand:- start:434 stop:709 length:276 start_codon:yes stop_codon:yes gene_type:complete
MDMEYSIMLTETYTKEIFKKIKYMEKAFIYIQMVQDMKEIGLMTNKTDKDLNHGLMDQNIKVVIKMEKNMDKAYISGLMDKFMMENGYRII